MVSSDQIQAAAATLGLAARDDEAEGIVEGRPVSLRFGSTDQEAQLFVCSVLDPPLDLGLEMHRRQVVLVGVNTVTTGSDDLDSEFSVGGDDPSRSGEFFTAALCEHLVALHRASYDVRLHDGGCTITEPYGFGIDEAWIVRAARAAAQTVALLDDARAGLRAAAPLAEHAEALRTFAAARSLAFTSTPLSVAGRIDGRPIRIGSVRTGRGRHHLTAHASFETELGIGVTVRRAGLLDGLQTLLGGQDITVGDEAFDRHFLVRADPAQAARVPLLLDCDVRVALLGLDERAGLVTVDDRGVTVEPILAKVAPETVVWAIDALAEARARIEHNLLHGGVGGPYR